MAVVGIAIYASIILWVIEGEYVYPRCGPLAFFTYLWGIWLYWSVAVFFYCLLGESGVAL